MFDVIGKRRWFYLFSLLLTIPGLIFILISPFSDAGLQLTIDYTGGTRWEIKFADPNVTPEQVEQVFAENGLRGDRDPDASPGSSRSRPSRSGSSSEPRIAVTVRLAGASPRRAPSRVAARRAASASPPASRIAVAGASASASPGASCESRRERVAVPVARRRIRQHRAADRRQARRDGHRPRGGARRDRGAAQPDDDRCGRQLGPAAPGAAS